MGCPNGRQHTNTQGLQRFFQLVSKFDIDAFTGYNVWFDLCYTYERICHLMGGIEKAAPYWSLLGRLRPPPPKVFLPAQVRNLRYAEGVVTAQDASFSSKAYGKRKQLKLQVSGPD